MGEYKSYTRNKPEPIHNFENGKYTVCEELGIR